jgi:ABC-type lipoprotein export system ATPase subunit
LSVILDKIEVPYIKSHHNSEVWAKHLSLEHNKKLNIFAPSGTGKTSLFNVISAMQKPSKGRVLIEDQDIHSMKKGELVKLRKESISLIFQDLKLISALTVLENICILRSSINIQDKERLSSMMERLNILNIKDKNVSDLSQGEKQRTAIIRSIFRPFKYLIMDEPFSHLDNKNEISALRLIEEEVGRNEGGLIMLSLHRAEGIDWDSQISL